MVFALKSKVARDTVIKEFNTTNYGVVNPRTLDNVIRLFPSCLYPSLTLGHSFTNCYTNSKSTIPSLSGRNVMATKKRSVDNLPCHLMSPSAITPLLSL